MYSTYLALDQTKHANFFFFLTYGRFDTLNIFLLNYLFSMFRNSYEYIQILKISQNSIDIFGYMCFNFERDRRNIKNIKLHI